MIVQKADVLLITHRRLFAEDLPRFFIGRVDNYADGLVLISGYSWVRDSIHAEMKRKDDLRTKVVSLSSGTALIYQLPGDLDIAALRLESAERQQLFLVDGHGFSMNITDYHGASLK